MRKICSHTYDDIISPANLLDAWCEFRQGKKKKADVQEFEMRLMENILTLHHDLKNHTYGHGMYQHFTVSDPKRRDIHKACVRDRVLHHALYRTLYPFFDTTFIADSYSCRKNKGTHRALRRFELFTRKVSKNYTGRCFVLSCDIRKFFASIDHVTLLSFLKTTIEDESIITLLANVIGSFTSGVEGKGLPLGNLTSQLLVNVYMNEFDQYVKHTLRVPCYMRYADDFVFVSDNSNELEGICHNVEDFLAHRLKLTLHPGKVFIRTHASGIDFLGWVHFPYHRVLRTTTKKRMMRKVTTKNLTSYLGLLGHGNVYELGREVCESVERNSDPSVV